MQGITISLSVKSAQISSGNISVKVSRISGTGDLTGVKFIFSDGSNTESFDDKTALGPLQEKTFLFTLHNLDLSNLKTVSIAPIYSVSGKETIGNIVDTFQFSAAQIANAGNNNGNNNGNSGGNNNINCGDNVLDSGEVCDGILFGTKSCTDSAYGSFTGGSLTCNSCTSISTASCTITVTGPVCGDNQCVSPENTATCPTDCPVSCTPRTCNDAPVYECGTWSDGCGGTIDCLTCTSGNYCTAEGKCLPDSPLNSGTIDWVWPLGAVKYFDSPDLPKNNLVTIDNLGIGDFVGNYVKFSEGETRCMQISYAEYLNAGTYDKSYLRLVESADIQSGYGYEVWRSSSCGA